MTIRPLFSFALGVACTALFVLPCIHGLRYQWEREAWEHGAGYFTGHITEPFSKWHFVFYQ